MTCPYCGNALEKGFVQTRDALCWAPKRLLLPALSILARGSIPLRNDGELPSGAAHALRCSRCGLVLIPREGDPLLK